MFGARALLGWRQARRIEREQLRDLETLSRADERRFLEQQRAPLAAVERTLERGPGGTEVEGRPVEARPRALPPPGTLLADRYEVDDLVASGGVGFVLRARDRDTGAPVALKILRPELARDERWVARLSREFRLARQIQHPNVCPVLDMRRDQSWTFLVLPLAARGTLVDVLADRPEHERLADARAVIAGLAAVHAAGIVHRDLTPRNVLRLRDGRLAVADFGLALDPTEPTSLVGGTPGYIAPEVLRGERPTPASDVWQLGVLLHQILFGGRPRWTVPGGPPLAPTTLTERERRLALVCLACLADPPAARPPDARAVLELWEEAEAGGRDPLRVASHTL